MAALVGGILYFLFGDNWWRLLIVIISVPVVCWTTARLRDHYMRSVARNALLTFTAGFPPVPAGSPAHGRLPWGFTGYMMTGQQDGVTFNVYEHSYRMTTTKGTTSRAHGVWWRHEAALFPEFDVRVRSRLDVLTSFFSFFRTLLNEPEDRMQDIEFRDDQPFSARFIVQGVSEAQVQRLFTPQVRRALLAEVDSGTVAGKATVLAWDRPGRLWGGRALAKLMVRGDRLRQAFTSATR